MANTIEGVAEYVRQNYDKTAEAIQELLLTACPNVDCEDCPFLNICVVRP